MADLVDPLPPDIFAKVEMYVNGSLAGVAVKGNRFGRGVPYGPSLPFYRWRVDYEWGSYNTIPTVVPGDDYYFKRVGFRIPVKMHAIMEDPFTFTETDVPYLIKASEIYSTSGNAGTNQLNRTTGFCEHASTL